MHVPRGIFLAGTDTGVGKTYVGVRLIESFVSRGMPIIPRKPVESGCKCVNNQLVPADAAHLCKAAGGDINLEDVCPYRLPLPLSPERAAHLEGVKITLTDLEAACQTAENTFLLVEGAGGFYSPLTSDGLNADLAKMLGLPVVIVAADRLGCINHTLLTYEAADSRELTVAAIALNALLPPENQWMDNAADLRARLSCPVVTISYGATYTAPGIRRLTNLVTGGPTRP